MAVPVDKLISFHIERQFPAIYREEGKELVQFVKEYYKFLETDTNQGLYNGRRLFEYRDIDQTLDRLLIFFKNKYLADLPFDDTTVRIIVKNILGLYRRKGTQGGLELFFRLFYNEFIKVYYPARDIFKPSDSKWQTGNYLQLFPNAGIFTSTKVGDEFVYNDIVNKTIVGESSGAKATVDKINFFIINNSFVPIIFINDVNGTFLGSEGIFVEINGVPISFGIVNGALDSIEINADGTGGHKIGEAVTFQATPDGIGATGRISSVSDLTTGTISYEVEDSGWGYTVDSTHLYVSDQLIFLENETSNFTPLEVLEDTAGNRGMVVNQGDFFVGVRMEAGDEFSNTSVISTVDRSPNINIQTLSTVTISVTPKNSSSPGDLFPETLNANNVIVGELENIETIGLIFDVIADFVDVPLDAMNYNDIPPALRAMSGTEDPVDIDTKLEDAFDITDVEIGSIVRFDNIDPGISYINDVVTYTYDSRIAAADRNNQLVTLVSIPSALSIGDVISQGSKSGKVVGITNNTLTVRPYSYYGFNSTDPVTYGGVDFAITGLTLDYASDKISGNNAFVKPTTNFEQGIIRSVDIIDSGFGYVNKSQANIIKNGVVVSAGIISTSGQGKSSGYWSTFSSHVNGYKNVEGELIYYNSNKYIHDSNYYQEYSYEVQSKLNIENYEESLKETTHVAGTKVFARFNLEEFVSTPISPIVEINRSE